MYADESAVWLIAELVHVCRRKRRMADC